MMHGHEKSDPAIVVMKAANKAEGPFAARPAEEKHAPESVERRAGAKGNANQPARTELSAGLRAGSALVSIPQAAMLDCQYPRWEPYAGKLQVRNCAGGARQLASLPRPLRRREFIGALGGGVAWPVASRAHQRNPVIGNPSLAAGIRWATFK
jgi:hypothetical protein